MALLILRHALNFTNGDEDDDDDASTVFSVSVTAKVHISDLCLVPDSPDIYLA